MKRNLILFQNKVVMTWTASIGFIGSQLLSETFAYYGRGLAFLHGLRIYTKD